MGPRCVITGVTRPLLSKPPRDIVLYCAPSRAAEALAACQDIQAVLAATNGAKGRGVCKITAPAGGHGLTIECSSDSFPSQNSITTRDLRDQQQLP